MTTSRSWRRVFGAKRRADCSRYLRAESPFDARARKDIANDRRLDGHRRQNPIDTYVNREPGTQREDQQRNDEAPKIDFTSIPEWMVGIGFLFRAVNAVE